jgi:Glycine zipper
MMRRAILALTALSLMTSPLAGQQPPPAEAPVVSPSSLGLFVYPAKNQPPAQQQQDEAECYRWAQQQTGIDPMAPAAAAPPPQSTGPDGSAIKGAAGGAAVGTAIGAIAGDTGEGAAIGAVAGAVRGRQKAKAQKKQAAAQSQQQAQAQQQQTKGTFNKAISACLEGRGYSIK